MARLQIIDKIYDSSAVDEVTLLEIIRLDKELKDLGLAYDYARLEQIAGEFEGLTADQAGQHPDALVFTAFTIWVARRRDGAGMGFAEAIDIPPSAITWLKDPGDRRGPTKKAAAKRPAAKKTAAKKATTRARSASARG